MVFGGFGYTIYLFRYTIMDNILQFLLVFGVIGMIAGIYNDVLDELKIKEKRRRKKKVSRSSRDCSYD